MMQQPNSNNSHFPTLVLQPHWLQYIIEELPLLLLWLALLVIAGLEGVKFGWAFQIADFGLFIYVLYHFICFRRIKIQLTAEQLVYKHGFLRHFSEYTELYRIVDYQEDRSMMQQLFRLKTIVLNTTDRSTPMIKLTGIPSRSKLIDDLRQRVEYNRRRKGIYEFTNNY